MKSGNESETRPTKRFVILDSEQSEEEGSQGGVGITLWRHGLPCTENLTFLYRNVSSGKKNKAIINYAFGGGRLFFSFLTSSVTRIIGMQVNTMPNISP